MRLLKQCPYDQLTLSSSHISLTQCEISVSAHDVALARNTISCFYLVTSRQPTRPLRRMRPFKVMSLTLAAEPDYDPDPHLREHRSVYGSSALSDHSFG